MKKALRTTALFLLLFSSVALAEANALEEGDKGPEVAEVQSRLISCGYRVGSVDGDFGGATTAAVKEFQKAQGLDADGIIGPATYRALMGRDIPVSRDGSMLGGARRIIQAALRCQGVPYVYGGTSLDGFDCSGFVQFVFARAGVMLPRTADAQYDAGYPVSRSRLRPGDTVYFSTYASGASHVGIYIGDGYFISATSSRGVVIDPLDMSYWAARYIGARRFM
ncbi:MAG: spore cortex-lytic enzyme [Firmicutes bacterium]|nr:spore cortex-lytic enzyme [Bacillota bacterium]